MKKEFYFHTKTVPRTTVCGLVTNNIMTLAKAECSPVDQFEKKIGRYIAKGRVEAALRGKELPHILQVPIYDEKPGKRFVEAALELINVSSVSFDFV